MRQLHVFRRIEETRPVRGAEDVLEMAGEDEHRVLELFDAPSGTPVVDLSLAERHLCEVITALHWAQEVHLHRVHPRIFFEQLPYVVPGVLEKTQLQVRGRWPDLVRESRRTSARLERWPGPVFRDVGTPEIEGQRSEEREPLPPMLDLSDARYCPRACGAIPTPTDDGRVLARVGLSEMLAPALRQELRDSCVSRAHRTLDVQIIDEINVEEELRAEVRRAYQAFIVPPLEQGDWSRPTLEALAQGLPIIVLGESAGILPPSVVFAEGRTPINAALGYLHQWGALWAKGESAPIDGEARRAWVQQLVHPQREEEATGPRLSPAASFAAYGVI